MRDYTEDQLVQKTVADYMHDELGWESVYAYDRETFGATGTLGRADDSEVVLERHLREAIERLNPHLPLDARVQAVRQLVTLSAAQEMIQQNREKYKMWRDGVLVEVQGADGAVKHERVKVFDFETPENNRFVVVRELWVRQGIYHRRADIVGFVNGIPLLFMELKAVHRNIEAAYSDNLRDYKDTIPNLLAHNAIVILSNGDKARLGSITSKFGHFHEWKRLAEEDEGVVDMETMLKGICAKERLLDMVENFILFDDSTGKVIKILARNHQVLGVNRAVEAVRNREDLGNRLGVFWHTQGSGKSYSMLLFAEKVRRKLPGNFSFLVVTDREDLDSQIYGTFAGAGIIDKDAGASSRATSGEHLRQMLSTDKPYYFTMIHKFNKPIAPGGEYSLRDDLIVLSDEAHRTQAGLLASNMRDALPNAGYMGFTGTPILKDDELTKRIFGDYVSVYDFQRAVEDGSTVALNYEMRGEKLSLETRGLNQRIAEEVESMELDADQVASLEHALGRDYHILTAEDRLDRIAKDFVQHYTQRWESGKAMFVCIDKRTVMRMHRLIDKYWQERIAEVMRSVEKAPDEQEMIFRQRQLDWVKETQIAPIFSEEQNEVDNFRAWGFDIKPHRRLMKEGFPVEGGKPVQPDLAFKDPDHPFRVAILCAMWLTGFDVPSLATVYLDKPLKAHTLMQAIARANRVHEGKTNGLIVDYCGITRNLRQALADYTVKRQGSGDMIDIDPIKPPEDLRKALEESIHLTVAFLQAMNADLDRIVNTLGFARIGAIRDAAEVVSRNDESRKEYRLLASAVAKRYRACIAVIDTDDLKPRVEAIEVIRRKLDENEREADIRDALETISELVKQFVKPSAEPQNDPIVIDISAIDFDRLHQEFAKHPGKNTLTHALQQEIQRRLLRMLAQNPLRTDFQERYEEIIRNYNLEMDRATVEKTFADLLKLSESLDEEEQRAVRENLSEDQLTLYDMLVSGKELTPAEIKKIKAVSRSLLDTIQQTIAGLFAWTDKEETRAKVRTVIRNHLLSDASGLSADNWTLDEVNSSVKQIYEYCLVHFGRGGEMAA